ncbi:MAG: alpha/beta hydrolase [Actinobacteria bacterium]|nr:alpha/beta hydrolase [Actinomycetota bacterium]
MRACVVAILGLTVALAACGSERPAREGASGPFRADVRIASTPEAEIAWYERGEGPPLLMLMGTGSTMSEWDPALLRLLARDRRLIMLDYPGLGLSEPQPWKGRSFDQLADDVEALMAAIGLERASVLGWSMGGFVAQRLAIRHPERVEAVVLAGTNPGGSVTALGTEEAQRIDSLPDPSEAEILSELYPPGHRGEGRAFMRRLERASQSGEIPDDFDVPSATVEAQVAAEDPWLRSDENYRQLGALGVPALAAGGLRDPVVPPLNLELIAARVPDGELALLPGAHAFLFQERIAFARELDRFLPG